MENQTLEKKVYSPWAFTENESEKAKVNREIYEEIKDKAICVGGGNGYGYNTSYMYPKDKEYFKDLFENNVNAGRKMELINELALIADGGNLCFGYSYQGSLTTYSDWQGNNYENVYIIKVYTD